MWQRCSLTDMLHALLSTVLVFALTIWRLRGPWSSGRAVILATCLELALLFDAYARAPGAMLSSRGPIAGSELLDSSAHPRAPPDTFSPLIGSKLCAVPSCSSIHRLDLELGLCTVFMPYSSTEEERMH